MPRYTASANREYDYFEGRLMALLDAAKRGKSTSDDLSVVATYESALILLEFLASQFENA